MVDGFRIVFVCTANICRSPMAEAMTRMSMSSYGTAFVVTSAGVHGHEGSPIAPGSGSALDALGVVHAGHRGRMLTREIVDGSDLILTMEAAHRDVIAAHQPEAAGRTFTLREFARLVDGEPAPGGRHTPTPGGGHTPAPGGRHTPALDGGHLTDRARALVAAAHRRRGQRPGIDDVSDPYGGPDEGYRTCAALIRSELDTALRPFLTS
ncbi:protein tyrosine phosphatase [Actinomadura alba]|uniref:protein-tyrosine-phosphatase n=1 Tax=Actinomadura alba TaxID=406431 RepID=A0ABR7LQL1_9ACTN|nr:protein tyrosine phosphatase [Actinomadura alba]MBC6467040.1 protein tyrosine phosphatase [Actinomadura alba]